MRHAATQPRLQRWRAADAEPSAAASCGRQPTHIWQRKGTSWIRPETLFSCHQTRWSHYGARFPTILGILGGLFRKWIASYHEPSPGWGSLPRQRAPSSPGLAFYADRLGRPSLRPGRYFRLLFIGYFEGLSSERGIAWRVADSLSLRAFLDHRQRLRQRRRIALRCILHGHREDGSRLQVDPGRPLARPCGPSASDRPSSSRSLRPGPAETSTPCSTSSCSSGTGRTAPTPRASASQSPMPSPIDARTPRTILPCPAARCSASPHSLPASLHRRRPSSPSPDPIPPTVPAPT